MKKIFNLYSGSPREGGYTAVVEEEGIALQQLMVEDVSIDMKNILKCWKGKGQKLNSPHSPKQP